VSTAQLVPETRDLSGDEAMAVMREARFRQLLADSIRRLRAADGFTHARSLALVMVLTVIPGVVVVVGAAHALGANSFRMAVADVFNAISPGQSGEVVTVAIRQGANENLGLGGALLGGLAMIVSGMTVFGQIERSANRVYGVEDDRPIILKYGRALGLFGVTLAITFTAFLILGTLRHLDFPGPDWLWFGVRSVVLVAASALGTAFVFRLAPRRRQPEESWLIVGSAISVVICAAATLVLAGMWRVGNAFGHTYGGLAGVVAFVLWTYLISVGLHVGLAFAAQLEAVRSGRSQPQDAEKVEESEPESCRDESHDDASAPHREYVTNT
jgi:YihY family inner membrane protein